MTIYIETSSADGFEFGKYTEIIEPEDMSFAIGLITNDVLDAEHRVEVHETKITDNCIVERIIIRASCNSDGLITIRVKSDSVQ